MSDVGVIGAEPGTTAGDEPFLPVDITAWMNNVGITSADALAEGAFNIWGNTFPAEELPAPGSWLRSGATVFAFPRRGAGGDNIRCSGQRITLPIGGYDWLHVLAAAERHTEDPAFLHYADGAADPEWLRISDFWPQTPGRFGEREAVRCQALHYPRHVQRDFGPVLWHARIPVPRITPLAAMRLPENPAMHVFAMTAQLRAADGDAR
jgi:hypothetical protein